jgi:pSer/pThr/pTyr-binding forkhead associated (FHA) protein
VVRLTADDEVDDHHFDVRVEGGRFVLGVRSPRGVLVSGRPGRDGGELTGGETLMAGRTVLAFRVRAATATR